jgi:hypothetical protein
MEEGYAIYRGKQIIMFFGSWASERTVRSIADGYREKGIIKGELEVKRIKISASVM